MTEQEAGDGITKSGRGVGIDRLGGGRGSSSRLAGCQKVGSERREKIEARDPPVSTVFEDQAVRAARIEVLPLERAGIFDLELVGDDDDTKIALPVLGKLVHRAKGSQDRVEGFLLLDGRMPEEDEASGRVIHRDAEPLACPQNPADQ